MVGVVIPVYKKEPSEYEKVAYRQCLHVLSSHDIYLVIPKGLDPGYYMQRENILVKEFPPGYFEGLKGYNALLLSPFFFDEFSDYTHILIYQLDCFVFRDELAYWCSKGVDYVAAPWINVDWLPESCRIISNSILNSQNIIGKKLTQLRWKSKGLPDPEQLSVGNGGLSLRNVKRSFEATKKFKKQIEKWPFSEDFFYSIFLPLSGFRFSIPSKLESLHFSFDTNPELCYKLAEYKLPFGCHGWYRTDPPYTYNLNFWESIINNHLIRPI